MGLANRHVSSRGSKPLKSGRERVNGAGIAILKKAGIELEVGVCAQQVAGYLDDWLLGQTV